MNAERTGDVAYLIAAVVVGLAIVGASAMFLGGAIA